MNPTFARLIPAAVAAASCLLSACATTSPAANSAAPTAAATACSNRYVDNVNLAPIVTRVLNAKGFMDEDYQKATASPSPFYSDLFGVQALATTSREQLRSDFVPKYATVAGETDHSITLKFATGYTAEFFPCSSLAVMGQTAPFDHAIFSGDTWRAMLANLEDFKTVLKTAGLESRYLIPNPYYSAEQKAAKHLASGKRATVKVDPSLAAFAADRNAVLLLPERVHGVPEDAVVLTKVLNEQQVAWLGLEMLGREQQKDLDAFNAAKAGTPAYDAARAKLVEYFANAWNGRAGPKVPGAENYYFKLVETAHSRGTKVYALESVELPFFLFRFGETPFGAVVRNMLWTDVSPSKGRGVLFGGSAHFSLPSSGNVQDFIAARDGARTIVSLRELAPPQVK